MRFIYSQSTFLVKNNRYYVNFRQRAHRVFLYPKIYINSVAKNCGFLL